MIKSSLALLFLSIGLIKAEQPISWKLTKDVNWQEVLDEKNGVEIKNGEINLTEKNGTLRTKLKKFSEKTQASKLTIEQSPLWLNWQEIPKVSPPTLDDAPVFLVKGPKDYWLFGLNTEKKDPKFIPEKATLDGFDISLMTTANKNIFNAPGGLRPGLGGYHAWQSRDMKNWVHHGPVTEKFSRWVTTAEYVDGKVYIYYDFPNDQDPHVYIDEDLTDGKPGKNMGLAFKDPSHGSDCTFIRDKDGKFHVIYEDWTPINAAQHSWDSPLAGHAVSDTGLDNFKILPPAVDERTKPTGKFGTYKHPHWTKEDPKNFKTDIAEFEIHEPEQNAFGDWAAITIGEQHYLFADFHEANKSIKIGWFTSDNLNKKFTFCGQIGKGHPDPDIGFAEGKFYLINQTKNDYISPGPWVEKVTVRVGADTDNDGKIDQWTDWQEIKETYDYTKNFAKIIKKIPASLDLTKLPPAYAFCFEVKLEDTTENSSSPVLTNFEMSFK